MKIIPHHKEIKEKRKQTVAQKPGAIRSVTISLLNRITNSRLSPLKKDTFSPRVLNLDMPGPHGRKDLEGKVIKNIELKDRAGGMVRGFILQDTKFNNTYYTATKDKVLCRMRLDEWGNYMYVSELYGQANNGEYKGAGTELLKFAVQKSKEKGYNGRLKLSIGGSPKFYYKNNFRINKSRSKDHIRQNAAFDFITRQNLWADDVWKKHWGTINVVLEEKEAEALLKGERLYNETHSEYMGKVEIQYQHEQKERKITIGIDFADLSNCTHTENVFVAQAYKKRIVDSEFLSATRMNPVANIEMRLLEDENGDKYLHLDTINKSYIAEEVITQELLNAIEKKMPELGAKYIRVDKAQQEYFD